MPAPAPAAPAAAAWESWRLDVAAEVDAFDPNAEPDWRLAPLVIPGTLVVVAGQGGGGKTWVMHEAAHAVATGTNRAGMQGRSGLALIIDGEMGRWLTIQRFAQQGYSTDIEVLEVGGKVNLTNPEHRQQLFQALVALQPAFVGVDSLSALTSGADENSREIADFVGWLRSACQEIDAAGMLLHHAGWKEERTRGSSAIRDRCDAVWYLRSVDDGDTPADESRVRELTCRGVALKAPRWSAPPPPLFMRLRDQGGLVPAEKPPAPRDLAKLEKDAQLTALRMAVIAGQVRSKADAADILGLDPGMATRQRKATTILRQLGASYTPEDGYHFNGDGPEV